MSNFRFLYAGALKCLLRQQTTSTSSDSEDETDYTPDPLLAPQITGPFVVLPPSLVKDPVQPAPPGITVETTEVYAESFSDEELEGIYHELFSVGPDLVPHMRTAEWLSEADGYLAELIRREGRGGHTTDTCYDCGRHLGGGGHRCMDCFDDALYCASCIVSNHVRLCLHRIQTWNGKFFDDSVTLKKLGMRVQLGHPIGEHCCSPLDTPHGNTFSVIDNTGVHKVSVDYCGCENAIRPHLQLLHHGWFPSSPIEPNVAATFSLLSHFQILASQSKVTALEFYKSLVRITDNTGTSEPKGLYPSFLLIVNQWCRIKSMKRAGRGNDPGGIAATPAGAGLVQCPGCPHPGVNIPEGSMPPLKSLEVDSPSHFKCNHLGFAGSAEMDVEIDSYSVREMCHGNIDLPLNTYSQVKAGTIWEKITSWAATVCRLNARYDRCPSIYPSDPLTLSNGVSSEHSWLSPDSFRRMSTKDTAGGSCQSPLNDVFGDRNWYEVTTIPTRYLSRIEAAARKRETHRATFKSLHDFVVANQTVERSAIKPLYIDRSIAHARAQKADERVKLLLEEMRRVVIFHKRKAEWWEDQLGRTFLERPQYLEGANAYAHRQAAIRRAMASHCLHSWRFVPSYVVCGDIDATPFLHGDNNFDADSMSRHDLFVDFNFLASDIVTLGDCAVVF